LQSNRPIEFPEQQQETHVDRILFFNPTLNETLVGRKLVIGEIKCRNGFCLGEIREFMSSWEKKNVGISVERRSVFRQRHDESQLLSGKMLREKGLHFLRQAVRQWERFGSN